MPKKPVINNPDQFQKSFVIKMNNQNLIEEVINSMPDTLIFVKDQLGRFVMFNNSFLKIFGLKKKQQLIGKSDFDFYDKKIAEIFRHDDLSVIKTGKAIINREERVPSTTGRTHWYSTTKTPLKNKQGKIIGLAGISRDITAQKNLQLKIEKQKKKLEDLNLVDPLTGAYNRRYFQVQIPLALKAFQRKNNPFSLLIIDFDNFKDINDTYGHPAGDVILKKFCSLVNEVLKRETDNIIRYGGDEFIACLFGTNAKNATLIGKRILTKIKNHKWPARFKKGFSFSVSIGAAATTKHNSLSETLKMADKALYQAKADGKNKICIYHSKMK